jgi:hypothetical protein
MRTVIKYCFYLICRVVLKNTSSIQDGENITEVVKKKRERHLKKLKVVAIQDSENITEVVKNGEPRKEKLRDVSKNCGLIINEGGRVFSRPATRSTPGTRAM